MGPTAREKSFEITPEHTIYLITGANRGLGLALTQEIVSRPRHVAVACYRKFLPNPSYATARRHPTSKVVAIQLDVTAAVDLVTEALERLKPHAIKRINVVIANAGSSPGYASVLNTPPRWLEDAFTVNCTGALRLLQACKDFLIDPEGKRVGKFVVVSSILGSIASQEAGEPVLAYGVSKAAVNFLVKRVDCEQKTLVTLALHPGWVKTEMGQGFADAIQVKEPPLTAEESAAGMLEQIEKATKGTTSGKFIDYKGTEIPW